MKPLRLYAALLLAALPLAAVPQGDAAAKPTAISISPLPYGINVHLAQDDTLDRVKAAGIAWIRIDVDWSAIETEQGSFRYGEVDRVARYAAANGLSIYASIGSTPGWANHGKGGNYPADDPADWREFVFRTVSRYKERVKYWGIWNEPNLKEFFALGKDAFVQRVFLPGAAAVRAADPAAFLVGPDLSHKTEDGAEWYFWLKYILDNAGNQLDVISHHLYEDLGVYRLYELLEEGDALIPSVREIVAGAGQADKPFWITETGWPTNRYAEAMQATRYQEMLQTRARQDYPQKVFFYEIIDDSRAGVEPFGILRSDREPKPAYQVYKDYIAGLLPDPAVPEGEKNAKKCYAEQTAGGGAPAAGHAALRSLYAARDLLRGHSAGTGAAVDAYYQWNEEFQALALADSRVFRLGRELLQGAQELLQGGGPALERPLPDKLYRGARALAAIIVADHPGSPLAPLALLADRELERIGRATPRELLEFCLREEMRSPRTAD